MLEMTDLLGELEHLTKQQAARQTRLIEEDASMQQLGGALALCRHLLVKAQANTEKAAAAASEASNEPGATGSV